nr:MAG TPA: recombination protein [Caudoviricetes sp.]
MIKEVDFYKWCKQCTYSSTDETDDPCNQCLNQPSNEDSAKPVNYKKEKKLTDGN